MMITALLYSAPPMIVLLNLVCMVKKKDNSVLSLHVAINNSGTIFVTEGSFSDGNKRLTS